MYRGSCQDEEEEDDYYHHRPQSLRQTLLNAASTWEAEREREQRQHRVALQ